MKLLWKDIAIYHIHIVDNKLKETMSSEEADGSKSQDVDETSTNWIKERAEKNRQKALLLRKTKLVAHPYAKE